MSSLTTIRNGDSSHIHSEGDPGLVPNNGSSSYLLRRMSTPMYVVASYAYCLFTSMFPPNQRGHDEVNTSRDVEMGGIIIMQAQANNGLHVHADSTSHIAQPILGVIQHVENQVLAEGSRNDEATLAQDGELELQSNTEDPTMQEASATRDPSRDVSGEHVSNPQSIGVRVVGILIIPIVIGVIGCLIQGVMEDQKVKLDQQFLLNLCFGASLATLFLGLVLFVFSIMPRDNPRRVLMIKFLVIVASSSAFVDICLLIAFGFIVMQSNAQ